MEPTIINFRPRDYSSVKNHPLSGITTVQWLRMLWFHGTKIDWYIYWPRLLFLSSISCLNSVGAIVETMLCGRKVKSMDINPRPVFILGHPRTGTTHLHNLLSKDKQFAFATTFSVGFPSSFICMQWLAPLMGLIMDTKRPMDNMALSVDTPQEDELATNILSSGISPYMPLMLMRDEPNFRKYYRLREEDGCTSSDKNLWQSCFLNFCRKLQYVNGGGKRLLLKSPVHTARVKLLHTLFPQAQFVFISRHPDEVFSSAVHMADAYYWQTYFQEPTADQLQEFILTQGEVLHDAYISDIKDIPANQRTEVRFDELNSDPIGTMKKLYDSLQWEGLEDVLPVLQKYTASLEGFKQNQFSTLTKEAKAVVRRRWANWFKDLNYSQ